MEQWKKKRLDVYTVDLTKISNIPNEEEGAFYCPKCRAIITPADETDENYQIIQTVVENNELIELILECRKCGATIRLVGFTEDKR